MKWIITMLLIIMFAVDVQAICTDRIYQVNLFYENQNVYLKNLEKITGCYPSYQSPDYRYEIVSDTDEKLYAFGFSDPGVIYTDTSVDGMKGSVVTPEVAEFSLLVPLIKNADRIDIYNPDNEKIAEIHLPEFNIPVFTSGQNVIISMSPAAKGFYKDAYIYFGDELKDVLIFDCKYMCYRKMAASYTISQSWDNGEYSIMAYDYTTKRWRTNNFIIDDASRDSEIKIDFR